MVVNKHPINTPLIPEVVYENLPVTVKELCSKFEGRERDIFLLSLITIIGAAITNVWGRYKNRKVYSNLFVIIVAPAASGKSAMLLATLLGEVLHAKIKIVASAPDNRVKLFFIPADISSARILQHLKDNGGTGIIADSEGDTLSNSLGQEWGPFSPVLRKSYHHEKITYSRKGDNTLIEIDKPKLALLITGTPSQIKRLFPSTENGLFSRCLFYVFESKPEWISPEPCEECDNNEEYFTDKGEWLVQLSEFFNDASFEVKLSPQQWRTMNALFKEILEDGLAMHGSDATGVTFRAGLMTFKIAMILTAIRKFESNDSSEATICSDTDFNSTLEIMKVCIEHIGLMLKLTPNSTAITTGKRNDDFYIALPTAFKRREACEIAIRFKFSNSTLDRLLKKLVDAGALIRIDNNGNFRKPD